MRRPGWSSTPSPHRRHPRGDGGAGPRTGARQVRPGGDRRAVPGRDARPGDLGPLGAHLVGSSFAACRGRVLFGGGSEVAVVDEPRLLEVIRGDDVALTGSCAGVHHLGAERRRGRQATGGGGNARFGRLFDAKPDAALPDPAIRRCVIATDRADFSAALGSALAARGVTAQVVASPNQLAALDAPDAVVVALTGSSAAGAAGTEWERILAEHDGLAEKIHADATWTRTVTDLARSADRALRLVTVTAAGSAGRRSRAQAAAQLARPAAGRPGIWSPVRRQHGNRLSANELVRHLVCSPRRPIWPVPNWWPVPGGSGCAPPHPIGSISFGGPAIPAWFDDVLTEMVAPQ